MRALGSEGASNVIFLCGTGWGDVQLRWSDDARRVRDSSTVAERSEMGISIWG